MSCSQNTLYNLLFIRCLASLCSLYQSTIRLIKRSGSLKQPYLQVSDNQNGFWVTIVQFIMRQSGSLKLQETYFIIYSPFFSTEVFAEMLQRHFAILLLKALIEAEGEVCVLLRTPSGALPLDPTGGQCTPGSVFDRRCVILNL